MVPQQTISLATSVLSSEEIDMDSPNTLTRRATALPICNSDNIDANTTEVLLKDTDEDVFTQYYAIDMTMDDMTRPDAKKIVHKFERNAWSGKEKSFYKRFTNVTFIYYIFIDLLQHEACSYNEQDE